MLVQFGNNWIQKIPPTAKLDSACGLVQFWLSSEFFSSNYFQIGQHVVLLHIQIAFRDMMVLFKRYQGRQPAGDQAPLPFLHVFFDTTNLDKPLPGWQFFVRVRSRPIPTRK